MSTIHDNDVDGEDKDGHGGRGGGSERQWQRKEIVFSFASLNRWNFSEFCLSFTHDDYNAKSWQNKDILCEVCVCV